MLLMLGRAHRLRRDPSRRPGMALRSVQGYPFPRSALSLVLNQKIEK